MYQDSDPQGAAEVTTGRGTLRYRFATATAEFLLCGRCGVCVAAVDATSDQLIAVLNLSAFDDPRDDLVGEPSDFDGESEPARLERRRARWTPVRVIEGA